MVFGQESVKKGDPCSVKGSRRSAQCIERQPTFGLMQSCYISFFQDVYASISLHKSSFSSWDLVIIKRLTQRHSKDVRFC